MNNSCVKGYNAPGMKNPQKYNIANGSKDIPVKCPMCNNKCFYAYTEHQRTYGNNGNTSKSVSTMKAIVKTMLPKTGRLVRSLSCSKCGYISSFREFKLLKKN